MELGATLVELSDEAAEAATEVAGVDAIVVMEVGDRQGDEDGTDPAKRVSVYIDYTQGGVTGLTERVSDLVVYQLEA